MDQNNYTITEDLGTLTVTDTKDDGTPVDGVVTKTHDGNNFPLDATITFSISVKNIYAEDKTVTLKEQTGVTITTVSVEGEEDSRPITPGEEITVGNVPAGKTITATATYTVKSADVTAGKFHNEVTASFSGDKTFKGTDEPTIKKAYGLAAEDPDNVVYSGNRQEEKPKTVTDATTGATLTEGDDYRLEWPENCTDATGDGFITVQVIGINDYDGQNTTVTYQITPAPLTITTDSDTKTYDGTALTKPGVNITGLKNGETVAATATGTQTNYGHSENGYTLDWNAAGTTAKQSNYEIKEENLGTLTVNKLKLTIKADDATKTYDGTALTKDSYTVTGGTLVEGDLTITVTGSRTNAGDSVNQLTVTVAKGKEGNYEITSQNGTLTVEKAPLTITTGSATKVYDGTALTCDTITVTGLVDGEATYKTTGTRTDVGKSENNYELTWTGGKESNYNITATLGTLTVTETGTVVTKTHAEGTYKAGDVVTFTITVTNPYEEAKDITVTEQDDVTITNITVDKVDYTFTPGKEVTVSNVQSKGVVNITATYTLKPADGTAGSYKNEVTVDINGNSFKDDDTVTVQKELKGENPEDVVYNGTTQEQEPVVKDKNSGTVLTKGTDYTLSYSEDTTNVGTVTVTITGMGEYLGSSDTVTYQITRRLLNVLTGTNSWKYDSYEHKEESFTVYDSEKNVVTALPGQDEGKTLSLTGYASQTLVGEKDNSAACGTELVTGTLPSGSSVTDLGEQKDTVTLQNYTVNLYYGTLKVTDGTDEDPVDPDLVVTKTHDETTAYKEGDEVTFTIEVTNIYDKPMKITLVEQDGMTMVKEDAPEGTTPTKSLEFKEVQPGDTVSAIAKYTITKADVESGTFSNKVTAKFDKKNFETTDTVKLTGLTVVKSLATINGKTDLTNAKVGDTVTYTITVTNNGEDALENVTVTDKLTTAKFDSVEDDNIQVDGNTCTIQSLAGKSTVTLTVTYQVLDEDVPEYEEDVENSGKLVNKVTAKAGEDGPEGGDKEVTPVARLEVSKDLNGDNETVKVGEEITYTITVKNTGSVELTNIQVEDDLETAVISDGTGYTVGKENKNTAEISSLAAGKTVTLTVTYTVLESDVKAGYLTNVATATAPNGPKDDDKEVTPVPGLKVMKTTTSSPANGSTYALGETITYAITVKNTGNEALTGITVTDELTGDTWTIASLGSGATTEAFTASHKVTEDDILAGKVVNVATAKTDDPDGPEGTGTTEDDTDDIDTTLEVKKEADKDKAVEGEKVTYTITVENKGNVDYTNVVVSDGLDGAKITSINAKNGYTSNDNGSITLKKLEVGETAAITVAYTITEADAEKGTVHNVATAKGDPIPDPADPDKPKTPEGKDEEDVDTEPMDTTLTVTKIADKDKAKAGETITYTITVKNDGNVDYKNVVVTDQFLAKDGESFVSGAAITKVAIGGKTVKVTDGSSSYTIDVLKAGETATITAEYTVQESDEGTITNVAIAKGETEDPDKVPEGGSDKVPTDVVFDLTVKKEWKGDSILTRPKSIKVTVFKDGIRYTDTVEITALGGWSAKFTVPKDGSAYTVAEEAVTGYTVKYSAMEGNTITITNTKQTKPGGGLLQTGQLNWPIPVLTFLGISMITGGAALTVGKKKDKYEG